MELLRAVAVSIVLVVGTIRAYWIITNTLFPLVIDLRVKNDGLWIVLLGAIPVFRVPYDSIAAVSPISRGELMRVTATRRDWVSLYVLNRLKPLVAIRRHG